jgi:hypothetical protein
MHCCEDLENYLAIAVFKKLSVGELAYPVIVRRSPWIGQLCEIKAEWQRLLFRNFNLIVNAVREENPGFEDLIG